MDLTYTQGELDYKNEKKINDSEMKREHDSVDDFEHLDPDSSPVDVQPKDFSTFEKVDSKLSGPSEMSYRKDHDVSEKLVGDIASDDLEFSKPISKSEDIISSGKDLESNLDSEVHNIKSKVGLDSEGKSSLLDFGRDISLTSGDKSDMEAANKSFLSSEIASSQLASHSEKTEFESDLLNLGKEPNISDKDIQGLLPTHDLNQPQKSVETTKDEFDNTKSMKEADALSQYEMKYEKKDSEVTDQVIKNDSEYSKCENSEPEPIAVQESTKAEPAIPSQQSEKPELVETKPEPQQVQEYLPEEPKDNTPEKEDHPLKHYIAICPPKPAMFEPAEVPVSDLDDIIGPEDVFKRIGLDAWFTPDRLHPIVEALVYWRDPKKSGVVFGSVMAILLSLCYMSLISVVAYSSLLALTGTICFRIYKNILQAVQKTSEGHPFKEFLELELSLPQDKVREIVDTAVVHINAAIVELRRLFLVEDLIDSIKFGVCLWCLTYVGAIFNGMTLVILAFVALFTVPKIYENNKASIDTYIDMGRSKVADITSKVKAAVPIGKKEPEKDKEQ